MDQHHFRTTPAKERGETFMYPFKIGVILDSFRVETKKAVKMAADLGVTGLQIYATKGEMSPEELIHDKQSEFIKLIDSYGLKVSALCGDMGRGFTDPEQNPSLIERSKRILDLANNLGTNIVTTHIGVVPDDASSKRYEVMQSACRELAEYADSHNSFFAVETGPETADRLKNFLDSLGSHGVAVNMDPANLVMVTGDDPVAAVYTLRDYIVHTHAKDGRKLRHVEPEVLYADIEAEIAKGAAFLELPLGQGDVDFPMYLKALHEIGYKGFLTIEREVGEDPGADIDMAVQFLREQIS